MPPIMTCLRKAARIRTPPCIRRWRPRAALRSAMQNERGSGILEFSLIAPAMLLIYCALGELAAVLEISRKTGSYTRTIADLVGRAQVDNAGLQTLFDSAAVILAPFDASKVKVVVSVMGVYKVDNKYYTVVCSSAARNDSAKTRFNFSSSTLTTRIKSENGAPAGYQYDSARYILAEVKMPFTPVLGSAYFKWINKADAIKFDESLTWPIRTNNEIVLPGGQACPESV